MSHYSQYRGRSVGRILHCLEVFVKQFPRIDETVVGDGAIFLHQKLFATYSWPSISSGEFDVPLFDWARVRESRRAYVAALGTNVIAEPYGLDSGTIDSFAKNQAILYPFVDDLALCSDATYLVQQIRYNISFDEALIIRHVRDKFNGQWDEVLLESNKSSRGKGKRLDQRIQEIMVLELLRGSVPTNKRTFFISGKEVNMTWREFAESYWQHFARCAILDI